MASIRERHRADGTVYYAVLHKLGAKQTSDSFRTPERAENFKRLVDTYGGAAARRIDAAAVDTTTLALYLTEHIDRLSGIQPGTIKRYRGYATQIAAQPLGELPLTAVNQDDIAAWVQALTAAGQSAKTVANKHGFLAGAMNGAVRRKVIPANPCDEVRLPSGTRREPVFLTKAQVDLLASRNTIYRGLVTWLVHTGMRFGEATALTIGDVNRAASTARITQAWKYTASSTPQLGPPKSKKSVRTISLTPTALALVPEGPPGALIFPHTDGGPIPHRTMLNHWHTATEGFNPRPRIHDLRHTCASLMIAGGQPLPVIQAHLGHESIQVTIGVYGHLDQQAGAEAAAAIAKALD